MTVPEKIKIDFTDDQISSTAGSHFIARLARRMELPKLLRRAIRLKQRRRGASDTDMLLSIIYCLCQGDGALVDVDRLGADAVRRELLGLDSVPNSRRISEYLARFSQREVECLRAVAQQLMAQVVGEVCGWERRRLGYVPLFADGTAIEVSGRYQEGACPGYNDEKQYWLHNVFVGKLWANQRLHPGDVEVAHGWRGQLEEIAPFVLGESDLWLRADNAYYRKEVVEYCRAMGWDYSISVTNGTYKRPLKRRAQALDDGEWLKLSDDGVEEATWLMHKPSGWAWQRYVAIRRWVDETGCWLLFPRYTFILTSCDMLPIREVVKRHRAKQGQENAQKGPLVELDLHHPPCLRFDANQAFYTLGQIAQILLVAAQMELLPEAARQHGLRPIIRDLVRTAGKLVTHAGQTTLKFAKTALRLDWLASAANRVEALARAPG